MGKQRISGDRARATRHRAARCTAVACLIGICACAHATSLDHFRAQSARIAPYAVDLAASAVKRLLSAGKIAVGKGDRLPALFNAKAAVFVTISRNGRRRGCKGSFEPTTDSLREEIAAAAVGAATADPRYRPVRRNELGSLRFTVSIVGPTKLVKDARPYSPARYGLLLRSGTRSGTILPGEAKTSRWRLAEATRQAGLKPGEPYELYVFETVTLRGRERAPESVRKADARHCETRH